MHMQFFLRQHLHELAEEEHGSVRAARAKARQLAVFAAARACDGDSYDGSPKRRRREQSEAEEDVIDEQAEAFEVELSEGYAAAQICPLNLVQ